MNGFVAVDSDGTMHIVDKLNQWITVKTEWPNRSLDDDLIEARDEIKRLMDELIKTQEQLIAANNKLLGIL